MIFRLQAHEMRFTVSSPRHLTCSRLAMSFREHAFAMHSAICLDVTFLGHASVTQSIGMSSRQFSDQRRRVAFLHPPVSCAFSLPVMALHFSTTPLQCNILPRLNIAFGWIAWAANTESAGA
jgi:hypothetical protein